MAPYQTLRAQMGRAAKESFTPRQKASPAGTNHLHPPHRAGE
jgi:hypothetical protein